MYLNSSMVKTWDMRPQGMSVLAKMKYILKYCAINMFYLFLLRKGMVGWFKLSAHSVFQIILTDSPFCTWTKKFTTEVDGSDFQVLIHNCFYWIFFPVWELCMGAGIKFILDPETKKWTTNRFGLKCTWVQSFIMAGVYLFIAYCLRSLISGAFIFWNNWRSLLIFRTLILEGLNV